MSPAQVSHSKAILERWGRLTGSTGVDLHQAARARCCCVCVKQDSRTRRRRRRRRPISQEHTESTRGRLQDTNEPDP